MSGCACQTEIYLKPLLLPNYFVGKYVLDLHYLSRNKWTLNFWTSYIDVINKNHYYSTVADFLLP